MLGKILYGNEIIVKINPSPTTGVVYPRFSGGKETSLCDCTRKPLSP